MRYIAFYLIAIAIFAFAVSSAAGALAGEVTCTMGSYGKQIAQQEGRC